MLTEQELNNIFNWLPYRNDWPIDRNKIDDGIDANYGNMISSFKKSKNFNLYISHDGGMSNYLEFLCYPVGEENYSGVGILVYISLCAPVSAYGQTTCTISGNLRGHSFLKADQIREIASPELKAIEVEIKEILIANSIDLLDRYFLSKPLSVEVTNSLDCALGNLYLDGIFQWSD